MTAEALSLPFPEPAGPSVVVHHGDCLDVLRGMADASVDAVVTDPPYATIGESASTVHRGSDTQRTETQFYEAWLREHLVELRRILKPSGALWMTIDWRGALCLDNAAGKVGGFKRAKIGVWDRGGLGMGYALRNTYECFAMVAREDWKRQLTNEPDVWRHQWSPGHRKSGHSAEKPVELFRRAVRLVTPPGGTILDPFAGSGTTLVAALAEGRNAIGIEREAEYVAIIKARVGA